MGVSFLAVLEGSKLIGVCARRELDQALGSRYGFALNAKRPIREQMMKSPLRVAVGSPITEVFKAASARDDVSFFDDVLLVGPDETYAGVIGMRTLVRLQTDFLLGNIDRLEASGREIAAKNREMESDLALAKAVQQAMLPEPTSLLSGGSGAMRLAHRYQPAGAVSGDFFDVIRVSEESAGVLICDVMGHGVRAAMVTAMIRAILEELRPIGSDPGALMTRLNRDLTRILLKTGDFIFVTAAYAVVPFNGGKLRYARAGHPAPLCWESANGKVHPLDGSGGPALGFVDQFKYDGAEHEFRPGDRLVLFTDGIFEAMNPAGDEFGTKRLAASLADLADRPLADALDSVVSSVSAFSAGAPFADDLCLVAVEMAQARGAVAACASAAPSGSLKGDGPA
jgi:sigma-B regulation protein RsbU (phosphoserine phosphatase)